MEPADERMFDSCNMYVLVCTVLLLFFRWVAHVKHLDSESVSCICVCVCALVLAGSACLPVYTDSCIAQTNVMFQLIDLH